MMHLVSPTLPTVLNRQSAVDLPGYDLFIVHDVPNVHVLPATIDLEKFKNALSDTLQMYPHAAGQMRCQDGRWSIELTNSCVPVDVSYARETTSSSILQGDWVIQEALASLVYDQPVDGDLINGTTPLVRFKLTFFMEETCIGITWNHALGDATVLFRFTHTLSQFYQNKAPEFAIPTFRKHVFPSPSEAIAAEYHSLTQQLNVYPIAELGSKYAEAIKGVESVQWRFTGEELRRLHAIISSSE
ncbi:hypothetical protein SCLCIDRAFT_152659 [Scleroderma citrinum Foug A]|uniref:Condensation domain-containing protein n=1 Tax=Scleroderma citrinum Foug A TaxID=1036808 RepID=A0A0C3ECR4_9AGAM|nr:hypothetical protein SCLCIDRAFT_152659 [Scleroderma citrinum Foug A]